MVAARDFARAALVSARNTLRRVNTSHDRAAAWCERMQQALQSKASNSQK